MELNQIVLTSIIGLISGGIASLIAPWVHWGIEKKKLQYKKKRELIDEFKSYLKREDFDRTKFVNSSNYFSIRKYLSPESIEILESINPPLYGTVGDDPFGYIKPISIDINKLEKEWKII